MSVEHMLTADDPVVVDISGWRDRRQSMQLESIFAEALSDIRSRVMTDVIPDDVCHLLTHVQGAYGANHVVSYARTGCVDAVRMICGGTVSVDITPHDDAGELFTEWHEDFGAEVIRVSATVLLTRPSTSAEELFIIQSRLPAGVRLDPQGRGRIKIWAAVSFAYSSSLYQLERAIMNVVSSALSVSVTA